MKNSPDQNKWIADNFNGAWFPLESVVYVGHIFETREDGRTKELDTLMFLFNLQGNICQAKSIKGVHNLKTITHIRDKLIKMVEGMQDGL